MKTRAKITASTPVADLLAADDAGQPYTKWARPTLPKLAARDGARRMRCGITQREMVWQAVDLPAFAVDPQRYFGEADPQVLYRQRQEPLGNGWAIGECGLRRLRVQPQQCAQH